MANAPFQIHFLSLYRRGGCFWGHVILSQHVSTPRPTRRLAQVYIPATLPAIAVKSASSGAVLVRGQQLHAPDHGGWVLLGVGQVWVGNRIVAAAPLLLG